MALFLCAGLCLPGPAQGKGDPGRITAIYDRAEGLRLQGAFDAALPLYAEGADLGRALGLPREESRARLKFGLMLWNLGKVADAGSQFAQARAAAEQAADRPSVDEAGRTLALVENYKQAKKFRDELALPDKALERFEAALRLADSLGSPDFKLKCLRQASVVHFYRNDLVPFFRMNTQALALAEQTRNERDQGVCLNNIGIYYLRIGEYSLALNNSEKALDLARKFNNPANIADALNNLCVAYSDLGEFDRAIESLRQVLELDRQTGDPEKQAMDFNNLGIAYRRKGLNAGRSADFEAAAGFFEKALAIVRPGRNTKLKIKTLNNLGAVFAQTGRGPEALIRFQEALDIADRAGDAEESSIILNNIGIVHSGLGDYARSTLYYQKAIDLATRFQGKGILWEIYLDLANTQRLQNRMGEAEENYRASIAIIEDLRSSIETEELKATYFGSDKRMDAYFNLADLYAARLAAESGIDTQSRLFEILEKAKARAFLDSLEVSNIEIAGPVDAERTNRERSIIQEITGLYRDRLLPGRSGERDAAFKEKISDLESRLDRIRREARTANPGYAALRFPHIANLGETRAALVRSGTTILAFLVGSEKSWGFAVTAATAKAFPLPGRKALRPQIEAFLQAISDKDRKGGAAGFDLFRSLVQPGLNSGTKNLIIVPDDLLNYVPFEALPLSVNSEGRLVDRCVLSYAPSVSSLLAIREREPGPKDRPAMALLAIGAPDIGEGPAREALVAGLRSLYPAQAGDLPPIPFAQSEIEKIANFFPARKTTRMTGAGAEENAVKNLSLVPYRIIHFAAHGFIDDKNPSRSALVLAQPGKGTEDGLLQTREIFRLRTRADLVVLSSCQTALGRLLRGEGLEGLNRAFFYSGSSAVLMTLWSIHDQAGAQFMERFYGYVKAGSPLSAALSKAKLDMIASPYYSHPYYWAGYVLHGDGERVVFRKGSSPLLLIAAALATGLAAWGGSRLRKRRQQA